MNQAPQFTPGFLQTDRRRSDTMRVRRRPWWNTPRLMVRRATGMDLPRRGYSGASLVRPGLERYVI